MFAFDQTGHPYWAESPRPLAVLSSFHLQTSWCGRPVLNGKSLKFSHRPASVDKFNWIHGQNGGFQVITVVSSATHFDYTIYSTTDKHQPTLERM